jgi:hypothetical protein
MVKRIGYVIPTTVTVTMITLHDGLLLKSIENDVDAAKTHLNNHVTTEEIQILDKDCGYCQIISKSSSGNEKYVYKNNRKRHCLLQIS